MKKSLPAAAFVSLLLSATIIGTLLVNFAAANPIGWVEGEPTPPRIVVLSPKNNEIYAENALPLTFNVDVLPKVNGPAPYTHLYSKLTSIEYRLDGVWRSLNLGDNDTYQSFSLTLTGLSDGVHTVEVFATALWSESRETVGYSSKFVFIVDTTSPSVSIQSMQGRKYGSADVSLNFTVSEQVSWVGYSLDGKAPVTITENTAVTPGSFGRYDCYAVLTGLPDGVHTLTVRVKDLAGYTGESEPVSLATAQETQPQSNTEHQSEPFPATLIVVSVGSVAAVSTGLILYFKKRHP